MVFNKTRKVYPVMNYSTKNLKRLNIFNPQQPQATYWLDLRQNHHLDQYIKKLKKDPLLKYDESDLKINPTKIEDIFNLLIQGNSVTQISHSLKIAKKLVTYHLKKAAVAADHFQVINGQISYRSKQQRNNISDPVYIVNQIHWLEATIKTKIKELHRKIHQYDDQFNPINDLIKTNYQTIATDLRQRHPSIQQILDALNDQDRLKGINIPHLSTFYRWIQQKRHGWDQTYYAFRPYKKVKKTQKHQYKKHFRGNFQTYDAYYNLDDLDKAWSTWQLDSASGQQNDRTWIGVLTHQVTKMTFIFKSAKNPVAFKNALMALLKQLGLNIKYLIIDNGQENTQLDQIDRIGTIYRTYPMCPQQKAMVERMILEIRRYDGFGDRQSFDLISDQDCQQVNRLLQNRKLTYWHQGTKQRITPIQYQQLHLAKLNH